MIVLVSGGTATHRRYWDNQTFGHLVTPRSGNSLTLIGENGKPWAADNDCFGGWDRKRELAFSKMLGRICEKGRLDTLKFVTCPDAVADSALTMERFAIWEPILHGAGLPVAIVAQDGQTPADCPWDSLDALFVGGSTDWKLSEAADDLILEAKRRQKWVHVGRVNSFRRVRHFHDIGVDSIDGTCMSNWPDVFFPKMLRWLSVLKSQPTLF